MLVFKGGGETWEGEKKKFIKEKKRKFWFLLKENLFNVWPNSAVQQSLTHTHTHTHTYIYMHTFFSHTIFHHVASQETG